MSQITDRQKEILLAIIKEFMLTAKEVGSTSLVEKYDLGISSATIRNEMMRLMSEGYLEKSHISSGRIPTDQALRLYVKELLDEKVIDSLSLVQIRQGIFSVRFDQQKLIKTILEILVNQCNAASFILMDDMTRYFGVSYLMKYEELKSVETLHRVLDLLEDTNLLRNVFEKYNKDDVSLLIGTETGIEDLENCTIAYTNVDLWGDRNGYFGIIGSRRLDYAYVIQALKTIKGAVEESLRGWK